MAEEHKSSDDESSTFAAYDTLNLISVKLRGLGFLIENQEEVDHPLDMDNVRWGIGMLLNDLSVQVKYVARDLERKELGLDRKKVKKKKPSRKQRSKR